MENVGGSNTVHDRPSLVVQSSCFVTLTKHTK